ncbi:phosphotransferase [Paenibacillus glycanilyticus]|uniref:phosphotransferase n=1 Tax=Paenibacillus glycanilyticus TaxID=126569 RepID=UPI00203B4511|nr:phosphotransferase [Paenibacillus glycanilyticus]MCM3627771.1 phosphotransferase [Paenibacillus glycanilyticus]
MIPTRISAYQAAIPMLHNVTEWTLLRQWALSEVYRVTLATGESRIIKWGGNEMAGEANIYDQLVYPLQIKAPAIFHYVELQDSGVMVMEDAGDSNLEEQPMPAYFLEAARELARFRLAATANLESLPKEVINAHTVSSEDFLCLLEDLLRSDRLAGSISLLRLRELLPPHLAKLEHSVPLSIVHHDYHAKNLLIQHNGGIMPIDWSNGYLSPHLGDLYRLILEAQAFGGLSKEEVIAAYREDADITIEQLNWQISVGGLCWLIKTLRWLAYGGTEIIPGSDAWVPDLMNDVEILAKELRS